MTRIVRPDKPGVYQCIETNCKNQYEITNDDMVFYKARGWLLPLRCQPCRDSRRNYAAEETYTSY